MLNPPKSAHGHWIAVVRDTVEVVAIIAAGIWAIYTFIYVQQIKPDSEAPSVNMTGTLDRVGERDGMIALRYNIAIRNTGTVPVVMVAAGFTVMGERFAASGLPLQPTTSDGAHNVYARDAHVDSSQTVYRQYRLTRNADPHYQNSFTILPGDTLPESGVIAVRRGRYDEVVLDSSIAYGKDDRVYPVSVTLDVDSTIFNPITRSEKGLDTVEETLARTVLW